MINRYALAVTLATALAGCDHQFLYPGTPDHCVTDGDCPSPADAPECSRYVCGKGDGDPSLIVAGCTAVPTRPGDICNEGVGSCVIPDPKDVSASSCAPPVILNGTTCTMPLTQAQDDCASDAECNDGSDCTIDSCVLASEASAIRGWCLHTRNGGDGAHCTIKNGATVVSEGVCMAGACCAGN